jgi:hypothetical protein
MVYSPVSGKVYIFLFSRRWMMNSPNTDINETTALIVHELYTCFPDKMALFAANFPHIKSTIFSDAMKWLEKEGYLRYAYQLKKRHKKVTLTSKGLQLMGMPFAEKETEPKEALGKKIKAALLRGQAKEASQLLKQGLVKFALWE